MSDVKIRDGAALASVDTDDEFEVDTGADVHYKVTAPKIVAGSVAGNGILERTGAATVAALSSSGTGNVARVNSPTLVTPYWEAATFGQRSQQTGTDRVAVSGSATTVFSFLTTGSSVGLPSALVLCNGYRTDDATKVWSDLILVIRGITPVVVASTSTGTPAARTWTSSGDAVQLAMAANTYNVSCLKLEQAN